MSELTEASLSARLEALAESAQDDPNRIRTVIRRTRTGRVRRAVLAGTVGVALVAGVAGGIAASLRSGTPTRLQAATSPGGWTPRGDLVKNTAFIQRAVDAWNRDSGVDGRPEAHVDISVLYAGTVNIVGAAAILEGRTSSGQLRLAIITGGEYPCCVSESTPTADIKLGVIDDRVAPEDPLSDISVVTTTVPDTSNPAIRVPLHDGKSTLAFALAAPGKAVGEFTGPTFDAYTDGKQKWTAYAESLPGQLTAGEVFVTLIEGGRKESVAVQSDGGV